MKNLDDPGFTCDVTLPESQLEINLYSHDIFSGGILGANVPVMCGGLNKIGQTKDDCMTLNGSDPTVGMTDSRYQSASIILSILT